MNRIKKWMALCFAGAITAVLSLGSAINTQAAEYWPDNVSVTSGAAIVVEMETGTVLYEKNADTSHYPASITKVMTALLALENCDLDEMVTFSEEAVYGNEGDTSHIAREVGEEMTLENCLYGMMLESANECAWAIGEHVGGGSMDKFVEMMNAKAKELGCTGTHFANPNGLPNPDHYVTARDMALIARAAYQYPEFRKISSTRAYTIPADNKKEAYNCNNTHGMISNHRGSSNLYEYALGGKTGYTDEAGNTLVTYAQKNGMTLLCVILDSSNPAHYNDTENLFEYCFQNFSLYSVADNVNLSDMSDQEALGSLSDKIDLIRVDEDGVVVLPNTASFADAQATVTPADKDADKGVVAKISYIYAGKQVGGANVIYEKNTKATYPFHNISADKGGSKVKYFRIDFKTILLVIGIILILLLVVYIWNAMSGQILLNHHRKNEDRKKRSRYRQISRNKRRKRKAAASRATSSRTTATRRQPNRTSGKPIHRNTKRSKRTR